MLPVWFTDRFPARYVHARLFDWPDTTLADKTLLIPPGLPDGLRAAAPERVLLHEREDRAAVPHLGARDRRGGCRRSAGPTPVAHRQQQTLDEPACRRHPVEPEPPWIKGTPIPFARCWPSHPKFSPTRSSQ